MPALANVLIYDSDTRGRETLVYGFEGDGVKAAAAATAAELSTLLSAHRPEIVVVTLREDSQGAVAFLKSLAEAEETRSMPCLVLGPADTLPEELRVLPGGISFIALPAFVRDVITACKLLVSGSPSTGEDGQGELKGALSDYGLYFIVRTMVGLARSGIVQVERGNRKGEIRFSEGDVVSAQVGPLQGHAALHQLLLWEDATLEIKFRPVVRLGQALPSGEELLEDCERFLRDFSSATKNIGHAQSLFVQDAERVARLLDSIPAEVVPVMRLFDGQRSLGDVLEDSPFRVFDTLRTITRLLDMGIIRRKAIERPTTGFGHVRRARGEESIRPGAASAPPGVTTSPTTLPAPAASASAAAEPPPEPAPEPRIGGLFTRRRTPRRRTGEAPAVPVPVEEPARRRSREVTEHPPSPPGMVVAPPVPPPPVSSAVHGELRIPSRNHPVNSSLSDVPKVVIDFGAVEEEARSPVEAAAPARVSGVRSAEFNTSPRTAGAAPGTAEGPSIMLDPHLLAEMDALERANAPANLPTSLPANLASAPSAPRDPLAAGPPTPADVVSFVHSKSAGGPASASLPINSAPTIPVPTVPGPEALPTRRASSEFDSVESDFFAREADVYQTESTENLEEIDPTTGQRGPR